MKHTANAITLTNQFPQVRMHSFAICDQITHLKKVSVRQNKTVNQSCPIQLFIYNNEPI